MPCNCNNKKSELEPNDVISVPHTRLAINCFCGISRLLPTGLNPGDEFTLVPCGRCGMTFSGRMTKFGIEEVLG